MRAIDRKLVRDLGLLKGPLAAIALVLACGIATFVMSLSCLDSLELVLSRYYARQRFADVFLSLERAPLGFLRRVEELPGVTRVEGRIVVGATLLMPDLPEPAVAQVLTLAPADRAGLNDVYLRRGRRPEPGHAREALVSEAFADAHGLNPGDHVAAIMDGRLEDLLVVGVALSPEFIYQIRPGELIPDDRRYGVFWMDRTHLAAAYDLEGACNALALTLRRGASEEEVIRRLDLIAAPYGGLGAYGRRDQPSHWFVTNEMKELRGMATIAPMIFLGVAVFLLNMVLARLVAGQRAQIGTLKALGFTAGEIGRHYLAFALAIALVGGIVGIGLGAWLGAGMTKLYASFFHFPDFTYRMQAPVVVAALGISVAAGLMGAWRSVAGAMALPPAEAMLPAPPVRYGGLRLERLIRWNRIGPAVRMIMRHLTRHPMKSGLAVLGIAMAGGLVVLGGFTEDAMDYAMDHEFKVAQRQDVTISFTDNVDESAAYEVASMAGVSSVEPMRGLAARIGAGSRSRRVSIMGLERDPQLFRLVDTEAGPTTLPERGIVLSDTLADVLGVDVGDLVEVELLEGERPVADVPVAARVRQFTGMSAYMSREAANRLRGEGRRINGAFVRADADRIDELYAQLRATPGVAGVTLRRAALDSFRETMGETMMIFRTVNVVFAVVIAVGVVYNTARLSLAERSRDLATLRVIGFTQGEISAIQLGELAILTVLAVPLGLALGWLASWGAIHAFDTELFRIPLVIAPSSYVFAAAVVVVAALISGLLVRRRLDHLDLVAVLKTRE